MTKTDLLIAAVVLGWACGTILRELSKPQPKRRRRKPRALTRGPISMDEAHSIAWEIHHSDDLIARMRNEPK